ncbi:hypothetical protein B0J13DRAFT_184154 [Dactylonectria estremocensis]|uniref:Uncharacterized protein n=1 Tax=Dactylonectria estremocensis TaxID=1079267 RepID=A0A9P9JEV4_9HYPO|nr:hypothetical protein B0J13DRAFT_184154 [Dactylonectria estremocensis]
MQLTWDLEMDHVRSWVLGGEYGHEARFHRPYAWSSTVVTGLSEAATAPQLDNASARPLPDVDATLVSNPSTPDSSVSPPSSTPPAMEELRGVPDDVEDALIPQEQDIRRIFNDGRQTWQHFLEQASALPRGVFPSGLEASIVFKDMPPLPNSIPQNGVLAGAPRWSVPDPGEPLPGNDFDLSRVTGTTKYFRLSYPDAVECCISSDPSATYYGGVPPSSIEASNAPQGLAILTMCWSYIFSTRLLHLQGRTVHYTDSCLRPFPKDAVGELDHHEILIQLPSEASLPLTQWLCALLAPKPGWSADDKGGPFSPWAANCTGDLKFIVATQEQVSLDANIEPPTVDEATDLIFEFCNLFGINHEPLQYNAPSPLSPVKAAFLATLAIPFYRVAKLQPLFPRPSLDPTNNGTSNIKMSALRSYTNDLQYYMTLSMHQWSLGPVLWSVFWQPDVDCNLVSPWLAATKSVLGPAMDNCDYETLVKTFAMRRPRVALWWHGLFLLGNSKIFDMMRTYFDTLDEGCSYDTLARPDIVSAAWTGAAQSYQDDQIPRAYYELDSSVPRADLLQHRHTLTLRDPWPLFYGWRPFGSVPKQSIEPDLYPWLERGHRRVYQQWTWWAKDDATVRPLVSHGYRIETARYNNKVPDYLAMLPAPDSFAPLPPSTVLPLAPSKRATLQMINHSLGNIVGERSISTAVIPELEDDHPWLKNWTPA